MERLTVEALHHAITIAKPEEIRTNPVNEQEHLNHLAEVFGFEVPRMSEPLGAKEGLKPASRDPWHDSG